MTTMAATLPHRGVVSLRVPPAARDGSDAGGLSEACLLISLVGFAIPCFDTTELLKSQIAYWPEVVKGNRAAKMVLLGATL